MSCQKFENDIDDLACGQTIEAARRERASKHVDQCQNCAFRFARQRAVTDRLRTLAENARSAEAPAYLEVILRKSFRQHGHSPAKATRNIAWVAGAAVAAMLLLFLMRPAVEKQKTPERAPSDFAPKREGEVPVERAAIRQLASRPVTVRRSHTSSRVLRHNGQTVPAPNEVTTDFMPLYGFDPIERGEIVRLRLPRSALTPFGLPVNEDRAEERIKADVLLGEDGLARAIRFVR